MSINQCQVGIDDGAEFPPDLFEQERNKYAKRGECRFLVCGILSGYFLPTQNYVVSIK